MQGGRTFAIPKVKAICKEAVVLLYIAYMQGGSTLATPICYMQRGSTLAIYRLYARRQYLSYTYMQEGSTLAIPKGYMQEGSTLAIPKGYAICRGSTLAIYRLYARRQYLCYTYRIADRIEITLKMNFFYFLSEPEHIYIVQFLIAILKKYLSSFL